jgi:multidrug efflux pump subunit AcrA (membrane-fusion protein)
VARVEDPYGLGEGGGRAPLSVGMFVRARIGGVTLEDVLTLPPEALRGSSRVWVVDDEDRLRFREVAVLRLDRERLVVSSGLGPQERVVVSPLEMPTDGLALRVEEPEPNR